MHNILFAVKFDNLSVYSSLSLMNLHASENKKRYGHKTIVTKCVPV